MNEAYLIQLQNYADLYRWSISQPEEFWELIWNFAKIIAADKGTTTVSDSDKMPGAKWFPDARLNYVQNLLDVDDQNRFAILFKGENCSRQALSYGQLYAKVSQLAQALHNEGVRPGDRVAAVLPNLPETVIAMLAASSIGAVWSSCSPDFGISGIADRFGQIDPKVLFVCGGYSFNFRFRLPYPAVPPGRNSM